jgi:flagellin-like hook-associated protein FlgL
LISEEVAMSKKDEAEKSKDQHPEDEDTQSKRIDELLDEGYLPVQIEKEWGYPHATVRDRAKKRIQAKGSPKQNEIPILPMVLKAGKSGQEVISPEALMRSFMLPDGEMGDWMLRGMMMLRAAQMMVLTDVEIMKGQADAQAKAIEPVLQVMEQARKDMDAAAQRARESNIEIAEIAAAGAAARAVTRIDEKFDQVMKQKADIATVPQPLQGIIARTMETALDQLTQRLFGMGGQEAKLPPGWVDRTKKGGQ